MGVTKFASRWTAILISGTWHLANVHWCSKKVSGVDRGDWELIDDSGLGARNASSGKRQIHYEYDESYFLTDPEQFIYSHFPKDPKWQLLARPVSLEEFTKMAKLESHFFEYRLQLKSHKSCVVTAPDGVVRIEVGIPPDAVYEFMYQLWISKRDDENVSRYDGSELKRYVFMEVQDGTLSCTVEFPVSGKFKIEIFCNDKSESCTYFPVCTYIINAENARQHAKAYPENKRPQWGPGHDLHAVGLNPVTHTRGVVQLDNGEVEMSFGADHDVDVIPKIHSNTKTADSMRGFCIYRVENKKLLLKMKFPEADDYALNLYAKEKGNDQTDSLPNVCSYLISTAAPAADPSRFFVSGSGQLGATKDFDALGMKASSPASAYVEYPQNGEMDVVLETPVPCDLAAKLVLCRDDAERNMKGFTFVNDRTDSATIKARFSERGNYMLKIYAKEKDKQVRRTRSRRGRTRSITRSLFCQKQ